ncbi:MAG: TetR/AcrR family transcriptional regulator [Streptosporangiaceae bacterium]
MSSPTVGRRERKNAQTRKALADAALRLFLERGYDQVSVKEIADAVDISVPTVFKHVPDGKEALIFDDGTERRESLLRAVRERPAGQSVMAALRTFMSSRGPFVADPTPEFGRKTELITNTPALRDYSRKLWIRCEAPLAAAIATEIGRAPNDITARAVARYVLEVPQFIGAEPHPRAALDAVFDLLEHGLPTTP